MRYVVMLKQRRLEFYSKSLRIYIAILEQRVLEFCSAPLLHFQVLVSLEDSQVNNISHDNEASKIV